MQVQSIDGDDGIWHREDGFFKLPASVAKKHAGTVAGATRLTTSPISHELSSHLDGNEDRDAFEFTAFTSQTALTVFRHTQLGLRGEGTVDLYTKQGVLVEPSSVIEAPFKNFVSEKIEKFYDLTAGEDYVAIVSKEAANAKGSYRLRIDARGDVLGALDLAATETLSIPEEQAGCWNCLTKPETSWRSAIPRQLTDSTKTP